MPKPAQYRCKPLLAATLVAFALLCRTGAAQDKRAREAKQAVLRLTALRAMVTRVHAETALDLPAECLVKAITDDLAQQRKPTDEAARTAVRSASIATVQGWMESVAKEVDPNREYGVLSWLSQKMDAKLAGRERSLREEFNARITADMKKDAKGRLIPAYRAARSLVADAQIKKAVGKYAPSEQQIIEAAGDKAKEKALVESVTEALAGGDLRQTLAEAEQRLQERAASVVADGIDQFHKLLDQTRGVTLSAYTPAGIRRELTELAAGAVREWKANPRADGGLVYDFLKSGADGWTKDEAARRFQLKLAEEVLAVEPSLPSDISATMAKAIGLDRRTHHKLSDSLNIFWVQQRKRAQGQVADKYATDAAKAQSKYDRKEAIAALPADVAAALADEKAACRPKWDAKLGEWKKTLQAELSQVRNRLAAEQARQHCPDLAEGRWRPTGKELIDPIDLDRGRLKGLTKLWQMAPPDADDDLLEEAWKLLETNARKRLQVGHEALAEQRNCVKALQDELIPRIKAEKGRTPQQWRAEYERLALKRWHARSRDKAEAVRDYPDLFDEVLDGIRGIVDRAMGVESPDGGPHVASGGPGTTPPPATKPAATAGTTGTGTSAGGAKPATKPASGDSVKSVVQLQSDIVYQVRPEIEGRIDKDIRDGNTPGIEETFQDYCKQVEGIWLKQWEADPGKYTLADRKLHHIVTDIIWGIVSRKLGSSRTTLAEEVRNAQVRLVRKHETDIRKLISDDKQAGEIPARRTPRYLAEYERLVQASWDKDSRSTGNYESLLPSTVNEIRNTVDRLVAESGKGGSGSGTEAGTATPGSTTLPAGEGTGGGPSGATLGAGGAPLVGGIAEIAAANRDLVIGSGMKYEQKPPTSPLGEAGGWFLRSGVSVLLIIPALVIQLLALWLHFSRGRDAGRFAASRGGRLSGSLDAAGRAMLRQMDLALECVEAYRPSRPIATLDDLYAGAQELLEEILRRWATIEDSRILPELQAETKQLAFGGVLAAGLADGLGSKGQ